MPSGYPHVPLPHEWLRTKVCSDCKQRKPWALFTPRTYGPDGAVTNVQSACKACHATRSRERCPLWYAAHREEKKAKTRARHRQLAAELRRDRSGAHGPRLRGAPFREWLAYRVAEDERGFVGVADLCGVPERSLRRAIREHQNVSLSIVDRCLTAFGDHLAELYPEEEGF